MSEALAGETGMTLIVVDPPTLLSKWVGESEKGLREVFKRAKQASPCIVLIDEVEAIASARTAEDSGHVSQRIVSQLFRELDELQSSLGVVVIATTHPVDPMEPALTAAGGRSPPIGGAPRFPALQDPLPAFRAGGSPGELFDDPVASRGEALTRVSKEGGGKRS